MELEIWLALAVGGGIGFWVGAFYTFIVLEIGRRQAMDVKAEPRKEKLEEEEG